MTAVPVTTTAVTVVSRHTLPIAPAAATERSVAGRVVPATAALRALQTFHDGTRVETAWRPLNAQTGAYALSLPIDAPVKPVYVPDAAVLGFVPDGTAAARYTLEARSDGVAKTQDIDVSAPVPDVDFTFP